MKTIRERIDVAWNVAQAVSKPVEWTTLESVLRDIVREAKEERMPTSEALVLVDEALGAFTRRGTQLQSWDHPDECWTVKK